MIKLPEPVSLLRCHTAQEAYHYTESQLKQAVRDAYEDASKACQKLEVAIDGGGNTYYRPADARQCVAAIRALIKEI